MALLCAEIARLSEKRRNTLCSLDPVTEHVEQVQLR